VAYFTDEHEVYEHIGGLLAELARDDDLVPTVQQADTVVQWALRNPEATITIDLRPGGPVRIDLGPTSLVPEVVLIMDADVKHRFWLGRQNVTVALARGQIRARGPVAPVLRLVPHVETAHDRYRAQLEAAGRGDLTLI
jgi:hypothetical protein